MNKQELKIWDDIGLDDLPRLASEIKEELKKPAIVFIEGKVGAGKTTFCQSFFKGDVLSPTYSLINEFSDGAHADLYRLKDPEELVHLEIELYLEEKDYFFVEWGLQFYDVVDNVLPLEFSHHYLLELDVSKIKEENRRSFKLSFIC